MQRTYNPVITEKLQKLISKSIFLENKKIKKVISLMYQGADPNIINCEGKPILLVLLIKLLNSEDCEKQSAVLIKQFKIYGANFDLRSKEGFTILQYLLLYLIRDAAGNKEEANIIEMASHLVRQGASLDFPDVLFQFNSTLKNEITPFITILKHYLMKSLNIDELITHLKKLRQAYLSHVSQSIFLNLLIYLSTAPSPVTFSLPIEILIHIINYLGDMKKTHLECTELAKAVFEQREIIKVMTASPGGINVFQSYNEKKQIQFTFFKSVKTLCVDYQNLKNKETKDLKEFREKYAIAYYESHTSLFKKKNLNQETELVEEIRYSALYNHPEIVNKVFK